MNPGTNKVYNTNIKFSSPSEVSGQTKAPERGHVLWLWSKIDN